MTKYIDGEKYVLIFRPYFKTKDGRTIWARNYGKKVFPMWVKAGEETIF